MSLTTEATQAVCEHLCERRADRLATIARRRPEAEATHIEDANVEPIGSRPSRDGSQRPQDDVAQAPRSINIGELKELFAKHLRAPDHLKKPEGLATGLKPLDRFLVWGGIPKGGLSLFRGRLGSGATSLWVEAAANVAREGKWVAWINSEVPLSPLPLHHKSVPLDRFVSIESPDSEKKLFWLLQELMSSNLFELIGCDLGAFHLKEHQIRKLQTQARTAHVALAFLSRARSFRGSIASVFSLIVSFERRWILVDRALHRPTPHAFPRSVNYARFTLHTRDRIGLGANFDIERSSPKRAYAQPHPLSQAARAAGHGA